MPPSDHRGAVGEPAEFAPIEPSRAAEVRRFFEALSRDREATALFHPHPFNDDEAARISAYTGQDYYAAMIVAGRMVAYGMLRGWDQGYEIPSLGIVVGADHRGRGAGRRMMEHLHGVARRRGARTIMLKVYKTNAAAVQLYRRMGYVLSDLNDREWKGTLDLQAGP